MKHGNLRFRTDLKDLSYVPITEYLCCFLQFCLIFPCSQQIFQGTSLLFVFFLTIITLLVPPEQILNSFDVNFNYLSIIMNVIKF